MQAPRAAAPGRRRPAARCPGAAALRRGRLSRRRAARLDEASVLPPDLVVEREELGDPGAVLVQGEEVVEGPAGPIQGAIGRIGPIERFGLPGKTLIPVLGQSRWNWPSGNRAAVGSFSRPNWLDARACARAGTRRRGLDHCREAGMRDGAVVALEEVLGRDLPVRRDLPVHPVVKREAVDVDLALGIALRRHLAENVLERRRRIRFTNRNGPQAPSRISTRPMSPAPESSSDRGADHQRSVQPVRPGVVGALGVFRLPASSTTTEPRCRHTLTNARSDPSSSLTTTTGTRPAQPGTTLCSSRTPTYCHVRAKIASSSRSSNAGSRYQAHGVVARPHPACGS